MYNISTLIAKFNDIEDIIIFSYKYHIWSIIRWKLGHIFNK